MRKKMFAEGLGTFILVSVLCAVIVGGSRLVEFGLGPVGIALAAGLALACLFQALAPLSGAHLNPAVSAGAWMLGRIGARQFVFYTIAQVLGASFAALAFFLIATFQPGFQPLDFGANGYGPHSPGGYLASAVFGAEAIQTFIFVFLFLRLTQCAMPGSQIALFVGFAFACAHLATLAISGTSLNPARSTATALFAEGWALNQLWLFWLAPMVGGIGGGLAARFLQRRNSD